MPLPLIATDTNKLLTSRDTDLNEFTELIRFTQTTR